MKSCLGETAKEVIENMLSHLEKEYEEVESFLSPQEVEAYRQYYREMPIRQLPAGRRLSFYRRFCRGYLRYMVTQMLGVEWANSRHSRCGIGIRYAIHTFRAVRRSGARR